MTSKVIGHIKALLAKFLLAHLFTKFDKISVMQTLQISQ